MNIKKKNNIRIMRGKPVNSLKMTQNSIVKAKNKLVEAVIKSVCKDPVIVVDEDYDKNSQSISLLACLIEADLIHNFN